MAGLGRHFYPTSPLPRRAAFTLVEVMIAVGVLLLVSSAVFTSLVRLQRNAAINRNYSCAQILLRNVIDQALTRGWGDPANPNGIIRPTIPGSSAAYDASANGWTQWNPFSAADDPGGTSRVPIYTDQMDAPRNVEGRLFRKVQRMKDQDRLLWITMRVDYTYGGRPFSQQMCTVRSLD